MNVLLFLLLRRLVPFGGLPALGFLAWQMPESIDGAGAAIGWLWDRAGGDPATALALGVLALALVSLFGGRLLPRLF
jgi:hypothetical protein